MLRGKGLRSILVALVLSVFLICWGGNVQAAPKKEITIAFSAFAPTLDPQVQFAMPTYSMCRFMFDPLIYFDWDMKLRPWLAEKWERLDDLTWKLYLKKGVKFHNGEAFNAAAVKYSMERYLDPALKSPQKKMYQFTKSVDIIDDYTVVVKTNVPMRPFLNFWEIQGVIPPKAGSDYKKFGFNPVGTGPYKFVEYIPNNKVVIEANPDYWGGRPKYDRIIFRLIKEDSTRVAALLTGEVDLITNVPFDSIPKIKENPKTVVETVPSFRGVYLAFHQKKCEAFKDKRVRQAFSYGVDRESLVKYILGGMAQVAKECIHPKVEYSHTNVRPRYTYNPEKAKKLLAEAGYPKGLKVNLGTPYGRYLKDKEVATAIAGQLQKIGVQVTVVPTDWGVFRAERGKGKESKFDLWLGAWGNVTVDADWALRWLNHSPTLHGHTDPKIDELLDKGRATFDKAELKKTYYELQEIIWEDSPVMWLYWQPSIYGLSKELADNFEPREDEFHILSDRYEIR
jgi:peptide/nickel transport system substrate-binding protein